MESLGSLCLVECQGRGPGTLRMGVMSRAPLELPSGTPWLGKDAFLLRLNDDEEKGHSLSVCNIILGNLECEASQEWGCLRSPRLILRLRKGELYGSSHLSVFQYAIHRGPGVQIPKPHSVQWCLFTHTLPSFAFLHLSERITSVQFSQQSFPSHTLQEFWTSVVTHASKDTGPWGKQK